jgi:iron-sulfur cluster repair protein YtfE (RIC family)
MADRNAEIDRLVDDHRELMAAMAELRRAAQDPAGELGVPLDRLEAVLAQHTVREEQGLFGVLRRVDIPDAYVGLFQHDHTHFADLIASARTDRSAVDPLLAALDAHMAREEDDMFPAAVQLLGPADWDAVADAVSGLP